MKLTCKVCGSRFSRKPRRGRLSHYCSDDCRIEGVKLYGQERRKRIGIGLRAKGLNWSSVHKLKTFTCKLCKTPFERRQRKAFYCSDHCFAADMKRRGIKPPTPQRIYESINAKWDHWTKIRRKRIAERSLEDFSRDEIFERDKWRCGVCGKKIDPDLKFPHPMSCTTDHVKPLHAGGVHIKANMQCAHLRCNVLKGKKWQAADTNPGQAENTRA